jgi:hypothetical protein
MMLTEIVTNVLQYVSFGITDLQLDAFIELGVGQLDSIES